MRINRPSSVTIPPTKAQYSASGFSSYSRRSSGLRLVLGRPYRFSILKSKLYGGLPSPNHFSRTYVHSTKVQDQRWLLI
jgi:hypothetical protein